MLIPDTRKDKILIGRSFCDENGKFGNPIAIVYDLDQKISDADRTKIANTIGYSETVFLNDLASNSISIYTARGEIDFAGHAALGAADHLTQFHSKPIDHLNCRFGTAEVTYAENLIFVGVALIMTPAWKLEHVSNILELDKLNKEPDKSQGHTVIWAWLDEASDIVRARTFAPKWGIPEDEANGSGCMLLAATLGRNLTIHHGKGSMIFARPHYPGRAFVGGHVRWDDEKELSDFI